MTLTDTISTLLTAMPAPTIGFGGAQDTNIQALARYASERITGGTSATVTLTHYPVVGLEQVFKNGTLLDPGSSPAAYTIVGNVLTLASAPLATDVLQIFYHFRNR